MTDDEALRAFIRRQLDEMHRQRMERLDRETYRYLQGMGMVPCPASAPHDGCVLCGGFGCVERLP